MTSTTRATVTPATRWHQKSRVRKDIMSGERGATGGERARPVQKGGERPGGRGQQRRGGGGRHPGGGGGGGGGGRGPPRGNSGGRGVVSTRGRVSPPPPPPPPPHLRERPEQVHQRRDED